MKRFIAAGAAALASLTFVPAHAATPTEVHFLKGSILKVGVDNDVSGYVRDAEGRIGGPAGQEPSLTFTLGAVTKTAKAKPNLSEVVAKLKPASIGDDQALKVSFPGLKITHPDTGEIIVEYAPSETTVLVDVYEHIFLDETGAGTLLVNVARNEIRVIQGAYDSGLIKNVPMTAASQAVAINLDSTDAAGDRFVLKGTIVPSRGYFAVAGAAGDMPIVLGRA